MSDPSGDLVEPPRPGPWLRLPYRAPRWLFRARLGWMFGNRFLLLTHRGTRTGRIRQTVLEVVRFDPDVPEWTVVSGHGTSSDWFRNLGAGPAIRLEVGSRRFVPETRLLSETERRALLTAYQRAHPRHVEWAPSGEPAFRS